MKLRGNVWQGNGFAHGEIAAAKGRIAGIGVSVSDSDGDGVDDELDEYPNDSERAFNVYYPCCFWLYFVFKI